MQQSSKRPPYGIRFRVIAPLFMAGVIMTAITYMIAGWYMADWKNDQMEERAERLHSALRSANAEGQDAPNLQAVTLAHADDEDVELLVVVDRDSQQVIASSESWTDLDQIPDPAVRREIADTVYGGNTNVDEELAYFYVEPLPAASSISDQLAIIHLNGDSTARDAQLATWAATGAIAMIALFVIGLTHSQLTRHVVEPVSLLNAALWQNAPADVIEQLGRRRDEIGNLARTVGGRIRRPGDTPDVAPIPSMDTVLTFDKTGKILSARVSDDQDVIPPRTSLVQSTIERHLPADVAELLKEEFDALSKTGEPLTFEFEHRSYGFTSTYEGRARAFSPDRVTLVFRDMTDYKQVEREIEQFEARVNRILHEVPPILTTMDVTGVIRFSNRTPFDGDAGDVIGKSILDFVPADQRPIIHEALDAVSSSGIERQSQIEIRDGSETKLWSIVVSPIESNDEIDELIMTGVEVTEYRMMEQRLHLRIAELEENIAEVSGAQETNQSTATQMQQSLDEVKQERAELLKRLKGLQASAPDDYSTPEIAVSLVELSNSIELLERTALNEGQRRYLATIQQQVQLMSSSFNLQPDKQEPEQQATRVPERKERILLSDLVDEVIGSAGAKSGRHDIPVRGAVQPGMPLAVIGDADLLRETLAILVERSLRQSQTGPVEIVVSREAAVPSGMVVRFDVYDDRVESSGGETGDLNEELAPAARNARAMGGSLAASRQANGGSLSWFTVTLGLDDETSNEYQWLRQLRTLIIQPETDDSSNLQHMLVALGVIGYAATDPPSVERAFRTARDFQNPYRLVLVDLDTPGLGEIIPIILHSETPVILIGSEEQAGRFGPYTSRVSGFLVRPIRHSELLAVLEQSVDPEVRRMPGTS